MLRKATILLLALLLILPSLSSFIGVPVGAEQDSEPYVFEDGTYRSVLSAWENEASGSVSGIVRTVLPDQFEGGMLLGPLDSFGRASAYGFDPSRKVETVVFVPETGLYTMKLLVYSRSENQIDHQICIEVNDQTPYKEACQITIAKRWRAVSDQFPIDRFGNDFYAQQEQLFAWEWVDFEDPMGLYAEPLRFRLEAGANTVSIRLGKGDFLIGSFQIEGIAEQPTYAEYATGRNVVAQSTIAVEAETPSSKNAPTIQPGVSRDLRVTPFALRELKLNTIASGTWSTIRQSVAYDVEIPTSGWYRLSFKVLQDTKTNGVVFRTLKINGAIPFAEAGAIPVPFSAKWQLLSPADENGDPYWFYLNEGTNRIELAVSLAPYREAYYAVTDVLDYVNATSLEIRRLTGNQLDEDRDWNILDYMPTLSSDMTLAADRLAEAMAQIDAYTASPRPSENESSLANAIRTLRMLSAKPNDIPKRIALLTTSSASIAQTLGTVSGSLLSAPLQMDKFYIHTDSALPKANGSFFEQAWLQIRRFFLSFFDDRYRQRPSGEELEVWVNRPKQYVDLIQKLADEQFTQETGIPVRISVLADEGKLILANSANRNPDVALGISSWMPYDLGIRGALLDLSTFSADPVFTSTLGLYPEQALIPMIYQNGLYGLPDTENFYVLFYRTDILQALGLTVPDTWSDVIKMMPTLRRFGMNFYTTLSSPSSLKGFDATLPFLFQYGSPVYSADAFSANLNNEASIAALRMMTELYTIYSLETTISSFYNDFRLAKSPIGIGDFGMYIRLLNAAPDIQGLWAIAPMPGVEQNGEVVRYAPGAQTANVVFQKSTKQTEAWRFLSWWSSTQTQIEFQNYLLSTLGREYMWNSANSAAFAASGFNEADMDIILEQWSWLKELPKVPGSYQVELEISNVWNAVVLNRANLRTRLNDGLITADREIRKKMAEFGYMDKQGNVLKEYRIATVEQIRAWKGE
jgi:ABC-type glycerol-3-phosphate transport system substrate-binding protein